MGGYRRVVSVGHFETCGVFLTYAEQSGRAEVGETGALRVASDEKFSLCG